MVDYMKESLRLLNKNIDLNAELVRCRLKLKQAEAEVERLNVIKNETPIDCDKVCVAYKYRVDENERLQTEVALLRKVEEVGEILWSEAICHRCNARECRGCAAHDFKKAMSEYQSWKERQELDKEGE